MTIRHLLCLTLAGSTACASVQSSHSSVALPPVADSSIFAPLHLHPAPSATRLATGAPGPKYWQNRADYDLHATLDTATRTVQGTMTLRYTNYSPDTLPFLWFQTEQNAFRGMEKFVQGAGAVATSLSYGDKIDQFTEVVDGAPTPVQLEEHQTETKAALPRSLRPGETATFYVTWHFVVPSRNVSVFSALLLRMGREGALYQVAQWYPRVNVYDDVKGWNIEPYEDDLSAREFFLEYGDFTLTVTVPATYIVAATGTLDNPRDVLTPTEITRLEWAAHTDTTVHVITAEELRNGTARLKHDGMVTWKFHAKNVRDAVFSASPAYQWDATNWHGILAQAYYRLGVDSAWHEAADMGRTSIQEYSEHWFPYPYPSVSVAEGSVPGGMEYPMISFDGAAEYDLLTHEIGHNWFPMIVGSNERVHPWMDEGLNVFINSFSDARRYPQKVSQAGRVGHQVYTGTDQPIVGGAYEGTAYVLQILRQDVLGPAVFDKAFRTYIRRWAYKHPAPTDFFRTMEDVSGRNLAWLWRDCFLEASRFDQAIDSVRQTNQGAATHVTVTYGNKGRGVFPLLVRFTFSDGTTQNISYPAEVWRTNSTRYTEAYTFKQPVRRIELDPDNHLPDANRANNLWTAP